MDEHREERADRERQGMHASGGAGRESLSPSTERYSLDDLFPGGSAASLAIWKGLGIFALLALLALALTYPLAWL